MRASLDPLALIRWRRWKAEKLRNFQPENFANPFQVLEAGCFHTTLHEAEEVYRGSEPFSHLFLRPVLLQAKSPQVTAELLTEERHSFECSERGSSLTQTKGV